MPEIRWTDAQLDTITARNRTVLVSAAAGSGKTAVLVERVLRRVTEEGQDIDRFLLVTFTKAAATEMRAKLSAALGAALAQDPENRRLRRQLGLLPHAQITTIHAFCTALLREHFDRCGLSPDFRITDEDEAALLKNRVLTELIEARYEDERSGREDFLTLVEALSAARDDTRLLSALLETYEKLQSHPDPDAYLARQYDAFEAACTQDPAQTVWGQLLFSHAREVCMHARSLLADELGQFLGDDALERGYADAFYADIAAADTLLDALERGSWDDARRAADMAFPRLRGARGYGDSSVTDRIKGTRDTAKKALSSLTDDVFCADADTVRGDLAAVLPAVRGLFSLVRDFSAAYADAKRRRNLADFNDLEHFTVRLLVQDMDANGDPIPSPAAEALSERFTEILIDEYQDTNEVQDVIFRALSTDGRNLFMVGDMKQSIYRFRLADPTIFLHKYRTFAPFATQDAQTCARILLSANFRSRAGILHAANFLFARLMSPAFGELAYTEEEYLHPGAAYPPLPEDEAAAELCLLDMHDPEADDAEPPPDRIGAEAAYVARRIRAMLGGGFSVTAQGALRPARAADIVILLRSMKNKAPVFEQALRDEGIPVYCDAAEPLFETLEVSVMTALLSVIDNPAQDLPLVSVMRSPLYGFTADELTLVRMASPGTDFFSAVQACAQANDIPADTVARQTAQRCGTLLGDLARLRTRAPDMPIARFIWHVYNETGALGLYGAMENGPQRQENLLALFAYAQKFEQAGYRGLHTFVRRLDRLEDNGTPNRTPVPGTDATDAVRIMSIHKSKGLEFPVVFICDCARRFNFDDLRRPVLLHPSLGAGFKRRETDRRIEYPTLPRLAIAQAARHELLSEELRVLYVGMTRPREKLIMTCALANAAREIKSADTLAQRDPIPPASLLECNSMLPWLLAPLMQLPAGEALCEYAGLAAPASSAEGSAGWTVRLASVDDDDALPPIPAHDNIPSAEDIPRSADMIDDACAALTYTYPHRAAAYIPSKLTATILKGRYQDTEAAEQAQNAPPLEPEEDTHAPDGHTSAGGRQPIYRRPRFATAGVLTPSERGSALHLAMQFIDPMRASSLDTIRAEIARMESASLLSRAQAQAVDPMKILRFFTSPLGKRMLEAPHVQREFKFSLLADAAVYTEGLSALAAPARDSDSVVLQGVIDCFFEDTQGKLVLLDFKTDFVPREGGTALLAARYRPQITGYAFALSQILGRAPDERFLYLFSSGEVLSI